MKMRNVYVDNAGNETTLGACDFALIGDLKAFMLECEANLTITNGITNTGLYLWDELDERWNKCPLDHEIMKSINKILITTENTDLWDIVITLDTNEEIVTNDEPVSMAEVYEAINTMRKPSFFGKRIKEIRIISH